MKRQISTRRRSGNKYGKKPFIRYLPKIKKVVTRSSTSPNLIPALRSQTGTQDESFRRPTEEEINDNVSIQASDVKIFRQSIKEAETKKISRECEITKQKIKLFRKTSQQKQEEYSCDPNLVCEEVIVPKRIPIREGDLDSTIVHVTKDEDIQPME